MPGHYATYGAAGGRRIYILRATYAINGLKEPHKLSHKLATHMPKMGPQMLQNWAIIMEPKTTQMEPHIEPQIPQMGQDLAKKTM